jgi:acetolactate synthase I/II/III large subunit
MRRLGASLVVQALEDEGIELAFGIPGTHNIELYDALSESESVRAILVTDEQGASFMADAAWRASGTMACVNLVPGAGLTHALSGIAEAFMDNVPMLVLGCGIRRDSGRAYQLHDIDQAALVAPITKAQFRPCTGDELYPTIRRACTLARAGAPGPVFVEVPANLYMLKQDLAGEPAWDPAELGTSLDLDARAVSRTVEMLKGARRVLVYAGAGATNAAVELRELVEALEAPVSTTFQGKGLLPEDHPLFLWCGFGEAAPAFVREVAAECDVTFAIGCRFSEVGTGSYGLTIPGDLIHVDIDPEVPGRNYPAAIAVTADAKDFLQAVLAGLGSPTEHPDEALRTRIQAGHAGVTDAWEAKVGGDRVSPFHLLRVLQQELGPDAVYVTDSGNGTFLAMEALRLSGPRRFLAPVDFSSMGYSVPGAVGAKLACPDRPVVALAGDGAFLMTGLELITAAAQNVGAMIFVLRDRELAQIAQFQDTAMNRKVASVLPEYDLEHLAGAVGAGFLSLDRDEDVAEVVRKAQAEAESEGGTPVLVDVAIDYSEKTYFTKGVVRANLHRLPLRDRLRFIGRALVRRMTG